MFYVLFANCASLFRITQGNLRMYCNVHRFAMISESTPAFKPEIGMA